MGPIVVILTFLLQSQNSLKIASLSTWQVLLQSEGSSKQVYPLPKNPSLHWQEKDSIPMNFDPELAHSAFLSHDSGHALQSESGKVILFHF